MRAIKEELGDNDDDEDDVAVLERKMQSAGMPANIWKHAQRELRYDLMPINLYVNLWFFTPLFCLIFALKSLNLAFLLSARANYPC